MKDALFPQWTAAFGFFIGAFVGSFLNMVIYRLPRGRSFSEPKRSFCPKCEHSLDWIDLFPLVSWLSTKGKCRYCHEPVAVRYFIVELLNACLFTGIWLRFMSGRESPDLISAGSFALATSALVAIIFIDWELYIIPDELNAFLLVVGLVYAALTKHLMTGLEGAVLGWGLIWGIALLGRLAFGKDAMGDGDIKMMRGVGALIGPVLLLANMAIAVVLGLVVGIAQIAYMSSKSRNKPAEAESPEEEPPKPTPVWVLLFFGVWYLFCLDVLALFIKPLDRWVCSLIPSEHVEEDDDWKPGATTIPFGPYLAAGALVCMMFGPDIERGMRDYWSNATGHAVSQGNSATNLGRNAWG